MYNREGSTTRGAPTSRVLAARLSLSLHRHAVDDASLRLPRPTLNCSLSLSPLSLPIDPEDSLNIEHIGVQKVICSSTMSVREVVVLF